MSEDVLTKLRVRKEILDKELKDKVSKEYQDLISKVSENIESMRVGTKDFYARKAQEELDKWEQAAKSGNPILAVSHKMMAETYLTLAGTL